MTRIDFEHGFYIKLGRGGEWAADSIHNARARIGWHTVEIAQIQARAWDTIRSTIREGHSPSAITADFNALKRFCESCTPDVWITFHDSKLWWARLCGEVYEDKISKYREVEGDWHDTDVNGRTLYTSLVSGRLAQLQAYRAAICAVRAVEDLRRLINADPSAEYLAVRDAKQTLVVQLEAAIKRLHWKDFELLVDLIFRQSGWRRISIAGETMEYADLELEDPITGDLYQVQIKARADSKTFEQYADQFSALDYRKLYFVVHTPEGGLERYENAPDADIQLIGPSLLATMVIDAGLTDWVAEKIK
jgi:hypothetical protein